MKTKEKIMEPKIIEASFKARVFEGLARPATRLQLAKQMQVRPNRVGRAFKELVREGRIFVSDWIPPGRSGHATAVYAQGQGVTPPQPRVSHDARILAALPATSREICERLELSMASVSAALGRLESRVAVSGWKKSEKGARVAIYGKRPSVTPATGVLRVERVVPLEFYQGCPVRNTHWRGLGARVGA